mgnify:CR=1 FL=1
MAGLSGQAGCDLCCERRRQWSRLKRSTSPLRVRNQRLQNGNGHVVRLVPSGKKARIVSCHRALLPETFARNVERVERVRHLEFRGEPVLRP